MKKMVKICLAGVILLLSFSGVRAGDLDEVRARGVLRHLGVPYANFVTGDGAGLSVELIKGFAAELGVRYQFVPTTWQQVIGDLSGKKAVADGNRAKILGDTPIRGDLVANGLTILPWRARVIDFSDPVFPTQVWLVSTAGSSLAPIAPSGSVRKDIARVKKLLAGRTLLGVANTCLDPRLYLEEDIPFDFIPFSRPPDELVPAIINGEAETALLDVPDALVALARWPGQFKVIGPVSPRQQMGVAFARTSPRLREAFNRYFRRIRANGTYLRLVKKYYPDVFHYYPEFFNMPAGQSSP